VSFRHNFSLEASAVDPNLGFDGGVLSSALTGKHLPRDSSQRVSMGGYNRTIAADRGSPIAGRQAWSGNSGGFMTTVVNVPAFQNPPGTKFRWRMASDNSGSGEGWRVDTLSITWCHTMGPCTSPRPTPAPRPVPSAPPSPHATPAFTPAPRPSP
jgi:hypothetical protein